MIDIVIHLAYQAILWYTLRHVEDSVVRDRGSRRVGSGVLVPGKEQRLMGEKWDSDDVIDAMIFGGTILVLLVATVGIFVILPMALGGC